MLAQRDRGEPPVIEQPDQTCAHLLRSIYRVRYCLTCGFLEAAMWGSLTGNIPQERLAAREELPGA